MKLDQNIKRVFRRLEHLAAHKIRVVPKCTLSERVVHATALVANDEMYSCLGDHQNTLNDGSSLCYRSLSLDHAATDSIRDRKL